MRVFSERDEFFMHDVSRALTTDLHT